MDTLTQVDDDIATLRTRLSTLLAHRTNLSTILLSQPHLSSRLQTSPAHCLLTGQATRNTENIHRACAGVTAYKVHDPDPHAVDNGNVLGIRVDVSIRGRFVETYHVLFVCKEKGKAKERVLSVHRHTVPPCIPLYQLALRWLPTVAGKDAEAPEQDVVRFGRALRKELVSWHMRVHAVEVLRREAKVEEWSEDGGAAAGTVLNAFVSDDDASSDVEAEAEADGEAVRILDIESDAAVRQITVTWSDRRTAVMKVNKDGRVERAVCRTKDGTRDVALSRKAIGPLGGLMRRLMA